MPCQTSRRSRKQNVCCRVAEYDRVLKLHQSSQVIHMEAQDPSAKLQRSLHYTFVVVKKKTTTPVITSSIALHHVQGLAKMLHNHLIAHIEQGLLLESQCGFRKDRSTSNTVFAGFRQFRERFRGQNSGQRASVVSGKIAVLATQCLLVSGSFERDFEGRTAASTFCQFDQGTQHSKQRWSV